MGSATVIALVLDASTGGSGTLRWFLGRGLPSLVLDSCVIWTAILGLYGVFGRLRAAVIVMCDLAIVAGFASAMKLQVRHDPLVPADLYLSHDGRFLTSMVPQHALVGLCVLVLATNYIIWIGGREVRRRFTRPPGPPGSARLGRTALARVGIVSLSLAILAPALWFPSDASPWRKLYNAADSTWYAWDQPRNYRVHGFVGGFLYNMPGPIMARPPGYSRATMDHIAEEYAARAQQLNKGRDSRNIAGVNVVQILSESLSDPKRIAGASVADDPIPFTRGLMETTLSGQMVSPYIGGGTANVEFEELTGLSVTEFAPQMNVPYQQLVGRFEHFPSAAEYLAGQGMTPVALHPFTADFYRRGTALPILGFDRFLDIDHVEHKEKIDRNPFVSDQAAFEDLEDQLRVHRTPLFLHVITMQNHFPMGGSYRDPWEVHDAANDDLTEAAGYLRGINYSDQALARLIANLRSSEEKTVVLLYGDHLPGVWPRSVVEQNDQLTMHTTPFLIWSNYRPFPRTTLSAVSPIYFIPTLLDQLAAPLTPFYALLHDLQREIPAMYNGRYVLPSGAQVAESDLPSPARALLETYRLVQYDLTAGEGYATQRLWLQP
jgi:hypothetical protein